MIILYFPLHLLGPTYCIASPFHSSEEEQIDTKTERQNCWKRLDASFQEEMTQPNQLRRRNYRSALIYCVSSLRMLDLVEVTPSERNTASLDFKQLLQDAHREQDRLPPADIHITEMTPGPLVTPLLKRDAHPALRHAGFSPQIQRGSPIIDSQSRHRHPGIQNATAVKSRSLSSQATMAISGAVHSPLRNLPTSIQTPALTRPSSLRVITPSRTAPRSYVK